MSSAIKIGVLGFQGAFVEHAHCLKQAFQECQLRSAILKNVTMETIDVRNPVDVHGLDGLIIPGGESTTMSKFLERNGFLDVLKTWLYGKTTGAFKFI